MVARTSRIRLFAAAFEDVNAGSSSSLSTYDAAKRFRCPFKNFRPYSMFGNAPRSDPYNQRIAIGDCNETRSEMLKGVAEIVLGNDFRVLFREEWKLYL